MKLIVISCVSFGEKGTNQMTSHVFGNSPSPAIASYSLCKTVEHADPDVKDFVHHNFYVEDGLIPLPNVADAISLMKRTYSTMKHEGQIRLHKIIFNKPAVMEALDVNDHGEQLKEIDRDDTFHRSLGLRWSLKDDSHIFMVPTEEKQPIRSDQTSSEVKFCFENVYLKELTRMDHSLLKTFTSGKSGSPISVV